VRGDGPGDYSIRLVERGELTSLFSLNTSEGPIGTAFEARVELSCASGSCGEVIVTLDPYVDPMVDSDGDAIVITSQGRERMSARSALRSIAQLRSIPEGVRTRLLGASETPIAIFADLEVRALLDESVDSIGAPLFWSESIGSGSVCVIDSGVDYTHPAFGECDRTTDINDGSCPVVIAGYDFVDDDTDPFDENGHGTHVAGIVASRDDRYGGVAPGARIVAARVLRADGSGNLSNVIEAIEYCTQNREEFGIRTIVMSLGTTEVFHGTCDVRPEAQAIKAAHDAGISVFVSAGNEYRGSPYLGVSSPACAPHAIAFGALDEGVIAEYSARDLDVIFAPGSAITSSDLSGMFKQRSGTSMAAPHGAGSALVLSGV
jgi:hypothetical protein